MKLTVIGLPVPQGSKTAFVVKGRAVVTDGKKSVAIREWRTAIADAARDYYQKHGLSSPQPGPIEMRVTFFLPRPKSASKRVQYPATKPDLSKLIRAVEDALSKIAYEDDARIVDLCVHKRFVADSPPRAEIEIIPKAAA